MSSSAMMKPAPSSLKKDAVCPSIIGCFTQSAGFGGFRFFAAGAGE
jgi:hypothetical protein